MRKARQIGAAPLLALAGISCSGGAHVAFSEDDVDAGSRADSGSFAPGTANDAGSFVVDAASSPTPTPTYDSAPPANVDSGPPAPCATPLIDDMEHTDGAILNACGRQGYWYTYNDGTAGGAQTPLAATSFLPSAIQGGRPLGDSGVSVHAARTFGNGFTTWGAGMAFDLSSPGGGTKLPYDASAYGGITFWARAGAATQTSLRVNIPEVATDPVGHSCAPKCNDHFGKTLTLTTAWAQYTLAFAGGDLSQSGWGTVATFDKSTLIGVQFQVAAGSTFDIWIDDIAFLE